MFLGNIYIYVSVLKWVVNPNHPNLDHLSIETHGDLGIQTFSCLEMGIKYAKVREHNGYATSKYQQSHIWRIMMINQRIEGCLFSDKHKNRELSGIIYIILYYIILHYIILYYIVLYYIILYYIILYHIILYYIILYIYTTGMQWIIVIPNKWITNNHYG
jgi:hypothetical protein